MRAANQCNVDYASCVIGIMPTSLLCVACTNCHKTVKLVYYFWDLVLILLDILQVCGVIRVTHVKQESSTSRSEERSAARSWLPASASRTRDRTHLRCFRLFRSARPRSGQVRDAAAGTSRRLVYPRGGRSLRVLPASVLSGSVVVRAWRSLGVGAEENRSPRRAQAKRSGRRFSSRVALRGADARLGRVGRPRPLALRTQRASPQRRASTRALEKKTPLTLHAAPPGDCHHSAEYERLRAHLFEPTIGSSHFALAILLREGVAAWIEANAAPPASQLPIAVERHACSPKALPQISSALRADIVAVMANMVIAIPEERCA